MILIGLMNELCNNSQNGVIMNPYYTEIEVDTWETARKLQLCMSKVTNWAFRGQRDAHWELKTNFERQVEKFNTFIRKSNKDYLRREKLILNEFKQRAHFYIKHLPDNDNLIEWLSLLQHYGTPTRLLDFSHSFYVAAFFAMEVSSSDCAIWALNLEAIEGACEKVIKPITDCNFYDQDEDLDTLKFSNYILNNEFTENLITYTTPFRMHERLSIQQGLFVFPCNLTNSFINNLNSTLENDDNNLSLKRYRIEITDKIDYSIFNQWPLIKIIIPHDCHNSALYDLKNMNITAATLFPGLDGFARSLALYFRTNIFDGEFERVIKKNVITN